MFARFIAPALILVALALGGCASSMDYSLDRKADGTTTEKEKSSCIGLFCGTSTARAQASVTVIPMATALNYGRYGRDHYYGGPFSYDPTPPVPYVTYGRMITDTIREAFVDGSRRICDVRPSAPHHCARIEQAHGWPRR